MRKHSSFGRALSRFCLSSDTSSSSCLCFRNKHPSVEEKKPLIILNNEATSSPMKLKDFINGASTLAFQLKPKMVVMRVSMHCNGCARKVEKHISKIEGVTSYQVDLETKMVLVKGDIVPSQVLESVSKIKYAQLWDTTQCDV